MGEYGLFCFLNIKPSKEIKMFSTKNVYYIEHSGFLVDLEFCYLLFDYYKGELPQLEMDKPLYIFVSHSHYDHYNPEIFQWNCFQRLHYILSSDVRVPKEIKLNNDSITTMRANKLWESPGNEIRVQTLRSTDQGVAFLAEAGDRVIYHAGDLNWWHWSGESDEYNERMEKNFKAEIEKIKGRSIDLAFLPLDPRQGEEYYLGFDYFMKNTNTKKAVPMHFWGEPSIADKLISEDISKEYRERILRPGF